jgi:Ca-activated chloride channel family protein
MKWGDPLFLKLLPVVVVLGLLVLWGLRRDRARARRLAEEPLWERLAARLDGGRRFLLLALPLVALAACLLGAARPQIGARQVQVQRSGIDIIFALDTSASMSAADVVPNRLARARREMIDFLDQLRGDRAGIVVFEGTAFLLCPLTLDYGAARLFLDTIEPGMLPVPGSNLAAALRTALQSFPREGNRSRAVVVLSDGEALEENLDEPIRQAREAGIKIYSIGLGTPAGEPIPERDERGNVTGYKKDRGGQVVLSRLDESTLRRVAEETDGAYHPATLGGGEVEAVLRHLEGLDRSELTAGLRTQYEERFQFFAGLALLCLAGLFLVPVAGRKEEWRGRF